MSAGTTAAPRVGRDPHTVARELGLLLRFRLSEGGRDPRGTVAVAGALVALFGLLVPLAVATWAPRDYAAQVLALLPTLWFAFLLLAVVASLASAGGRELLPRQAAVALPVSPAADQLGAYLLSPVNVGWSVQALLVLTATTYAVGPGWSSPTALLATWLWLATATALAQLLGWAAELARTYPHGPLLLGGLAAAASAAAVVITVTGDVGAVLGALPTLPLVVSAVTSDPVRYLVSQGLVVVVGCAALLAAVPVAERLRRRPAPVRADDETRARRRRRTPSGDLAAAVVTDVRSVLRSAPLRRGLLLVLAVPTAVAVLLPLPWVGVVVLPGLVASGTALLYGVNAASLDGRGALWRESSPQRPGRTLLGRLLVLGSMCGVPAAGVVALAIARDGSPSRVEVTAAAVAVVVATAQVVSRCAWWSVSDPHPAGLRHDRDIPAPPVTMARRSVQLSVATTVGALLVALGLVLGDAGVSVGVGAVLLVPAVARLHRAFRANGRLAVRSVVAATVSGA